MRSTRVRMRLERLEGRALLTTSVSFSETPFHVVDDKIGSVVVSLGEVSTNAGGPAAETVTLTTGGGTAVPGVDYTPVQQTITLSQANPGAQVAIPILPGPASLGTRTLLVTVSPTPGSPKGHSELIVITHGTDTTLPSVVDSRALTVGGKVVAFSVQFSKPMAIGPVTDLANYAIAAPASGREIVTAALGGPPAFSKNFPLKSAIYDADTNTVYLVPVKPASPAGFRKIQAFVIESPAAFLANLQFLKAKSADIPDIDQGFSKLADTSGNPVAIPNPVDGDYSSVGTLQASPTVAKASPSVLSLLLGTPAHATSAARPKPMHKAK